jgi:prepilin signal peptidase PulO-like enzyme (type II secretory pathway)
VTGLLFLAVYVTFGLSLQALFLWTLIALMMVTFWIDIDTMMIYDSVTFPGIALGMVYSWVITDQFLFSLAACLYAVAFLMLINNLTLLAIGEDGIGGGDLTLVAMLGAWLGLEHTVLAVALSMVIGSGMGLLLLFSRWLVAREWVPFALAGAFAPFAYVMGCILVAGPVGAEAAGYWYGAGLDVLLRTCVAVLAGFLGGCAGFVYMRLTRDEGNLAMPFGPALVLGGLSALFWGGPMIGWYLERLGNH